MLGKTSVVEGFPDANSDISFKLPVPTRQHMMDWVKEGFDYLVQYQEMVKKSFKVCGISSSDPDKVWNGPFFKQCVGKALHSTVWRPRMQIKLIMILLNCTINIPL